MFLYSTWHFKFIKSTSNENSVAFFFINSCLNLHSFILHDFANQSVRNAY